VFEPTSDLTVWTLETFVLHDFAWFSGTILVGQVAFRITKIVGTAGSKSLQKPNTPNQSEKRRTFVKDMGVNND